MSLRIRRGTEQQRAGVRFDEGEIVYVTDQGTLYIGDGSTLGGNHILKSSVGVGFIFNDITQKIDFSVPSLNLTTAAVAEDSSRLYYTNNRAKDAVGSMFQAGPNTGITFVYDANTRSIRATVDTTAASILPSDAGKAGHYLSTDGSGHFDWVTAPISGLGLPSELAGHQGQYLTTNGTSLVFAQLPTGYANLVSGIYTVALSGSTGHTTFPSNIELAVGADITRNGTSVLTGLSSIVNDTSPGLGGNLTLNGFSIVGSGNVNITGSITASTGIGADLNLNTHSITGTGGINIAGAIAATSFTGLHIGSVSGGTSTVSIKSANQIVADITGITNGSTLPVNFNLNASKGSIGAPANNAPGENLSVINFLGYFGGQYVNAASILTKFSSNATMSNSNPASSLIFATNNNAGDNSIAIFDDAGVFTAPVIKTGSYNTGSYPSPATAGMIIFDGSNNHFYGYNGTIWKQLDN